MPTLSPCSVHVCACMHAAAWHDSRLAITLVVNTVTALGINMVILLGTIWLQHGHHEGITWSVSLGIIRSSCGQQAESESLAGYFIEHPIGHHMVAVCSSHGAIERQRGTRACKNDTTAPTSASTVVDAFAGMGKVISAPCSIGSGLIGWESEMGIGNENRNRNGKGHLRAVLDRKRPDRMREAREPPVGTTGRYHRSEPPVGTTRKYQWLVPIVEASDWRITGRDHWSLYRRALYN